MNNKLTNEEIARVFAVYYGQSVAASKNEDGKANGKGAPVHNALALCVFGNDVSNYVLLLTPLDKITDEDAIEVANICHNYLAKRIQGKTGYSFLACNDSVINCGVIYHKLNSAAFQYLISKGYAVPLWFGIDHWANGKTAIELGIAIDKDY